MVHKTRDITETRIVADQIDEPVKLNGAQPRPFTVPSTHPDPERERELDALLEQAWPSIKTSMSYLRDR